MYLKNFLFLFFSLLTFASCETDSGNTNYSEEQLYGRWELTEAWRNNRKTETLTGTFYEFNKEGVLRTNFTSDMSEGEFDYEFDGKTIRLDGTEETMYQIDTMGENFLVLKTTFSNFPFKLALGKIDSSLLNSNPEM